MPLSRVCAHICLEMTLFNGKAHLVYARSYTRTCACPAAMHLHINLVNVNERYDELPAAHVDCAPPLIYTQS